MVVLQSLGADVVGINCSTGPERMADMVRQMKPYANVPILAKPNAGLPQMVDGETVYDMGADTMIGRSQVSLIARTAALVSARLIIVSTTKRSTPASYRIFACSL